MISDGLLSAFESTKFVLLDPKIRPTPFDVVLERIINNSTVTNCVIYFINILVRTNHWFSIREEDGVVVCEPLHIFIDPRNRLPIILKMLS